MLCASVSPRVAVGDASASAMDWTPKSAAKLQDSPDTGLPVPAPNLQQDEVGETAGSRVLLRPPATSERGELAGLGSRGWWPPLVTSPVPFPSTVPCPEVAQGGREQRKRRRRLQEGGQQVWGVGWVSFWVLEVGAGGRGHRSLLLPPLPGTV